MITSDMALEILINLLESLLIFFLYKNILGKKEKYFFPQALIGILVLTSAVSILNFSDLPILTTRIIGAILDVAFAVCFFSKSIYERFFWGLVPSITYLFSDSFTVFILSIQFSGDLDSLLAQGKNRIAATLMYLLVIALVFYLLSIFIQKKKGADIYFTRLSRVLIIFVLLISIVTIDLLMVTMRSYSTILGFEKLYQTLSLFCFLFLSLLVVTVFMFWFLGKLSRKNLDYALQVRTSQLEAENYLNMKKSMDFLNNEKHDAKDKYTVMLALLDNQKTDELQQFLKTQLDHYESKLSVFYTGNVFLDALLTTKLSIAADAGIKVSTEIYYKDDFPIDDTALCSLVANLLNNATEACKKIVPEQAAVVFLSIKPFKNMMCIQVTNTSNGEYSYKESNRNDLQTTKKDPFHGRGLRQIRETAECVGGFFDYQPLEDKFVATVMLPAKRRG